MGCRGVCVVCIWWVSWKCMASPSLPVSPLVVSVWIGEPGDGVRRDTEQQQPTGAGTNWAVSPSPLPFGCSLLLPPFPIEGLWG